MKKFIPVSIVRTVSRQILIAKKNSPHIFFAAGIIGTVTSTVLACRATLKLPATLDEIQNEVDTLKPIPENSEWTTEMIAAQNQEEWHTDPDAKTTVTFYVYSRAGLKVAKLYAPAIIVGAVSIAALTGSHIQLVRRNTALMAAYAAVQKAYEDYRNRVRAELGPERELEIYHASSTEIVKGEDGKDVKANVVDPDAYSPYAKFFDEYSRHWVKDPELNRMFVQCQQAYANQRLHAYGHVFLNEVYDMLGLDRSRAGAVVGWIRHGEGDGYIDFGIFEAFNRRSNEDERSILLDFNVDGVIYDKI